MKPNRFIKIKTEREKKYVYLLITKLLTTNSNTFENTRLGAKCDNEHGK